MSFVAARRRAPRFATPLLLVLLSSLCLTALAAEGLRVQGRVLDESGAGLAEAFVTLEPVFAPADALALRLEGERPEALAIARSDAEGAFVLHAPRPGVYHVRVEQPGFVPEEVLLAPLVEPRVLPPLRLARDAGLLVEVSLGGSPAAGALVSAERPSARFALDPASWRPARQWGRADESGRFYVARPAEGEWLVAASDGEGRFAERRVARAGSVPVSLEEGALVEVELEGPGSAGAALVAGDAGHPLGLAPESGRLALRAPAGTQLVAHASGRAGASARVELPARADAPQPEAPAEDAGAGEERALPRLTLRLPVTRTLSGRVLDAASGAPLTAALVWSPERPHLAAASGRGGAYALELEASASARLAAAAPGYMPATVRSSPARDEGPAIALAPAAAVEGRVLDEAGQPLEGASLMLSERHWGAGRVVISLGAVARPAQATSDAEGFFRLSPVDPERLWIVEARLEGRAPASAEITGLAPRRTLEGLTLTLAPGARLAGRVTDEEGRPLPGAELTLFEPPKETQRSGGRLISSGGGGRELVSASSDAEGRFELAGIPAGTYDLEAEREGFARAQRRGIEVAPERERVELEPLALAPEALVEGLILDVSGEPIAGAELRVTLPRPGSPPIVMPGIGTSEPSAISGPQGWFSLGGLAPGETFSLEVRREGYAAKVLNGVEAPSVEPLEIMLDESSRVSGVVEEAEGGPIAGARVTLSRQVSAGAGGMSFMFLMSEDTETDAEGRFVFEGLPPGEVSLRATAFGMEEVRRSVEIPRGQDVEDVELPLVPGAYVVGRVVEADGRPAVGATVRRVDASRGLRAAGESAESDGAGRFVLEGLSEGPVSIEALGEDERRAVREVELRAGRNELELVFEGGAPVEGQVVGPGGNPLAGALVSVSPAGRGWGGPKPVETGTDGRFRFESVTEGEWELRASHPDYAPSAEPTRFALAGEPLADLVVALARGGTIRGRVEGLDERELALVELQAYGGGDDWRTPRVEADGSFVVENAAKGRWRLVARSAEGSQAEAETMVEGEGSLADVELVFGLGLTLSGRIEQEGRLITNAMVTASGIDVASWTGFGTSDAEGRFRFEGLEPGRYRVSVRDWASGLDHQEEVELDADRDVTIEIPTTRVSGFVLDRASGEPLSGVRVSLKPQEGEADAWSRPRSGAAATSDLDGRFVLKPVQAGRYALLAEREGYAATTRPLEVRERDVAGLELELEATEGLIVDVALASGRPPAEVRLALVDPAGLTIVAGRYGTGEGGRVRVSNAPPGSWALVAQGEGSAAVSREVVAPGGPIPLALPPATRLLVEVPELAESSTLARLTLVDERGRPHRSVGWFGDIVDSWRVVGGRARVSDLPPGRWSLRVVSPEGRVFSGEATTSAAGEARVVLE